MDHRFSITCLLAFLIAFTGKVPGLHAQQRPEQFSEVRAEFISQLQDYMTASNQKTMEDTYKDFENIFQGGMFNDEEVVQIFSTANRMLSQRMAANPYFSDYLKALVVAKNAEQGSERFQQWHRVLDTLIADPENRRLNAFREFLQFSVDFFKQKALRYSETGTTWYALTDSYEFGYDGEEPFVEFAIFDLMASRKQDSLFIYQTSGRYLPVQQLWKGKGGNVTWERFGWDRSIYVELDEYEFEMTKSLYQAQNARLHYPIFFGNKVIEGDFEDKLMANNTTGGSYPRFQSYDDHLEIDDIGPGIKYVGGFRLQGATIYGFGSKEQSARMRFYDNKDRLAFRAAAEQFVIRPEERIAGESVEVVFYFAQDSIYHPSVNMRFDISKKEMQLSRGDRGSDRNPFYSSVHQVNIDAEKIFAYLDGDSVIIGRPTIDIARKQDIFFESLKYFNQNEYRRIQNIASSNPIAIMKVTAEREGTNYIDANLLARRINSKFTVDNIQSLIYDLMEKGFINYDKEKQVIEVKDKVFHYANADQGKVDFDFLRIRSSTDSTNATLNLRNNALTINGIDNIELSRRQKVAFIPDSSQVVMGKNRNLDFSGQLYAGYSTLEGKGFHFDYDKFQIALDSIRFFDLYVRTGELDQDGNPIALGITSRIENLSGVLLIDAPSNKSGREDIPMFPSLQSKSKSYVYYDHKDTQDSVYVRDSFYFEIEPFSFDHLDSFFAKDVRFHGTMYSAGIFPEFEETLTLQEGDQSLGFLSQTPEGGLDNYNGKGHYEGEIQLSNQGLQGNGTLSYLGASVNSEDFIFRPEETMSSAEEFNLEEDRSSEIQMPQVRGEDVDIRWRPYTDSMYVTPRENPFALFKEENHSLKGTLILTPDGLKGDGTLDWDKANMTSKYLSFGAFSVEADTTQVGIRAFDTEELALQTDNVYGFVDFEEKVGTFKANEDFLETTLPYNQYQTSMNEFDWAMEDETIQFKSEPGKLGSFVSIHPDQDSLRFQGESALYDLKTNELKIGGVPFIISADAMIYPDSGLVDIEPGGVMTTLENARIVADTITQHHVINRATVDILGRKEYKASGFYEYNIGEREQEIEFADIVGTRVGKGARSEKAVATRARGEVAEEDHFFIDHKTEFRGTISLMSETKNLQFDGFARLDADKLPDRQWFTVSSEGDKEDLTIAYDTPRNFDGEPLETGIFLSRETAQIYPRVMMPLYFRKDRPVFPVTGLFKYDEKRDEFIFGDSTKVLESGMLGNYMVFSNKDGSVRGEGKFNLGSGLDYVSIDAAGTIKTSFPQVSEVVSDSTDMAPPTAMPVEVDLMAGIKMILPEKLLKMVVLDLVSSTFDAKNITYLKDIDFYKKGASELFPQEDEVEEAIEYISSGFLDIPKKFNDYTLVFGSLKMRWDPDYQSFVSVEPKKVGLQSFNGESINKELTCYVEFRMPTNEDDRFYIYLNSPSELYYYFGFKQGILEVTSNNPKFMDELLGLKTKELVYKMDDGETYEILPVEPTKARLFLRRIEAANQDR